MPDPSHRPYKPMTIIRPNAKPRLWWLFPWSYARTLHSAANALRNLCDRLDDVNKMQADIILEKEREIERLKRRVEDLNDAVIKGIIPDAWPDPLFEDKTNLVPNLTIYPPAHE